MEAGKRSDASTITVVASMLLPTRERTLGAGAALDELHALATEKQLRGEWLRVVAFDPL